MREFFRKIIDGIGDTYTSAVNFFNSSYDNIIKCCKSYDRKQEELIEFTLMPQNNEEPNSLNNDKNEDLNNDKKKEQKIPIIRMIEPINNGESLKTKTRKYITANNIIEEKYSEENNIIDKQKEQSSNYNKQNNNNHNDTKDNINDKEISVHNIYENNIHDIKNNDIKDNSDKIIKNIDSNISYHNNSNSNIEDDNIDKYDSNAAANDDKNLSINTNKSQLVSSDIAPIKKEEEIKLQDIKVTSKIIKNIDSNISYHNNSNSNIEDDNIDKYDSNAAANDDKNLSININNSQLVSSIKIDKHIEEDSKILKQNKNKEYNLKVNSNSINLGKNNKLHKQININNEITKRKENIHTSEGCRIKKTASDYKNIHIELKKNKIKSKTKKKIKKKEDEVNLQNLMEEEVLPVYKYLLRLDSKDFFTLYDYEYINNKVDINKIKKIVKEQSCKIDATNLQKLNDFIKIYTKFEKKVNDLHNDPSTNIDTIIKIMKNILYTLSIYKNDNLNEKQKDEKEKNMIRFLYFSSLIVNKETEKEHLFFQIADGYFINELTKMIEQFLKEENIININRKKYNDISGLFAKAEEIFDFGTENVEPINKTVLVKNKNNILSTKNYNNKRKTNNNTQILNSTKTTKKINNKQKVKENLIDNNQYKESTSPNKK